MMKIDRMLVEDAIYEAELDEDSLYEGYSGRAMYGAKCFGLIVDRPGEAAKFLVKIANALADDDLADELADAWRSDSMGLSTIVYFPGFEVANDEKEQDRAPSPLGNNLIPQGYHR